MSEDKKIQETVTEGKIDIGDSKGKLSHEELFEKVRKVINDDVRPYLNSHGGDLEIVAFDEEKRLHVRLHGACGACPASKMTLYYVVEEALEEEFPEEGIEVLQVE